MTNKRNSIDGFIPRRAGSEIGEHHRTRRVINGSTPLRKELRSEHDLESDTPLGQARPGKMIGGHTAPSASRRGRAVRTQASARASFTGRDDIDASLRELDEPDTAPRRKLSRKDRRRLKRDSRTKAQRIRRRVILIAIWLLVAVVVAALGYLAFKAINASGNVLKGNIFDIVQNQPLKEDANGRSNFLVFGTAEDDEGGEHGGANLTDSIMVISVDQDKKDAYMVSLPRDLWARYEMPSGEACTVGYEGKLNAQYFCASNDGQDESAGAKALSDKVTDITGLDIQYYIHLNFTAVVEAVDAVGGVDVTIHSEDPRGILDRNFDWKCGYKCYYVNYTNGQKVHLDGEHALALARARNAAGGYGLPNGNFDREKNQQMIIKALLEKAVSAGTLTNLGAVTGLIDALGNNLRTNIETKEVRTLMGLGTKIAPDNIVSVSLNADGESLVTTGMYNGQSIVRPIAGITDYSAIQAYIKKQISSEPYVKEGATIDVLNGSGVGGVAQDFAVKLEEKGFATGTIDNAPEGTYQAIEIYQVSSDKPATGAKLKELYGVTPKTTALPKGITASGADYVIILGEASAAE